MNAYDNAFQNRQKLNVELADAAQRRQLNDYKLKRAPILDEQADADRALELGDEARTREEEIAKAQREAQMRGLQTLKVARDKGMDPAEAINALGPGGLKAFGSTFGDMGAFAVQAKEKGFLEAKIAGLSGTSKPKTVKSEEYVVIGGKPGLQVVYDDGTTEFTEGASKQYNPTDGPNIAQGAGLPGVIFDPVQRAYLDADGNKLSPAEVKQIAFDFKASQAAGTAAGKEGTSDVPWTEVQKIEANTKLQTLELKNENLNNAIDKALNGIDWTSAGVAGQLKTIGGAPANLASLIASVNAQVGLDELTKLKQSGVTLGQVTEAEHVLLQSMIANLSQISDPQVLREALQQIKQQSNKAWRITRDDLAGRAAVKGGGGGSPPTLKTPKRSDQYYD